MIHGGDIYSFKNETGIEPIDFSENTNPFGLPSGVKEAIANSLDSFCAYPDLNCRDLSEATGKYYNVKKKYMLFGNGAADVIFKISYLLKPKKAVLLAPTFAEYEIALKNTGTEIEYYNLLEENDFEIMEDIIDFVKDKLVFICNPNNPTGKVCSRDLLEKIAKSAKILVIDECFMDFVDEKDSLSFITKIEEYKNVIILKAFTKIFAMAGLRLGFCLCSDVNMLENINAQGQPWSVSTVAQVAGVACCSEFEYVESSLIEIKKEKEFLEHNLLNLGYKVFSSKANYILFRAEKNLVDLLKPQGIMLRSCSNYVGLDKNFYRIAVKKHKDNVKLIENLKEIGCHN